MATEFAYAFDDVGSGTVLDLSGNGRHITLTGSNGAQVSGGQTGGALGKTGATMPTLPTAAVNALKVDDWAIMFDALGVRQTWWFRCWDGTNSGVRGILDLDGTAMRGQLRTLPGDVLQTRPTAAVPEVAVWHNYCLTYQRSGGLLTLYRDGVQASQVDIADGTQASNNFTIIDLAEWSTAGPAIDNVRGMSHCPDAAEVLALAGTPVTAPAEATLAGTLPKATMAAEASAEATAALAGTLSKATFEGQAVAAVTAELGGVLPRATASITVSEQATVTATLAATLPKIVGGTGITTSMELRMQRRNTEAFIEASPVDIALTPQAESKTPSGAVALVDGVARPVQRFRLIPMAHTERPVQSTSGAGFGSGGVQRKYDLTLLGTWDSVIQENDYWYDGNGQKYVVDAVIPYNGYERKGLVMSYGRRGSIVA